MNQNGKYKKMLSALPIGIALTTRDGRVLCCNDVLCETFGYTCDEISRVHVADLYDDPAQRQEMIERFDELGSVRGMPVVLKGKSGRSFQAWIYVVPFCYKDKAVFLATVQKCTESE